MNGFYLAAGACALGTFIGHNVVGIPQFLKPMLAASFDPLPKRMLEFSFHAPSVMFGTAAVVFLYVGTGEREGGAPLAWFAVAQYGLLAVLHVVMAATSGIPQWWTKMFHGGFFAVIALLGTLGAGG